jgi:alpha-glucosidase (family GH31 glycosyl hydrolase)
LSHLHHAPEGDYNPYVHVAWSRHPLSPTAQDVVQVGIRTDAEPAAVRVEWRCDDQFGSESLTPTEGGWTAAIGPFSSNFSYRFSSDDGPATDWFSASVGHWVPSFLASLSTDGDTVTANGDRSALSLSFSADAVEWAISDELDAFSSEATEVLVNDWTVVVANGQLQLSGPDFFRTLSLEALHVDGARTAWRLSWNLGSNEHLYGTGERFDTFDQMGRTPDVRVYEEYKEQDDRTYLPLPWVLSDEGYGLSIDGLTRVAFDLGAKDAQLASATLPTQSSATGRFYLGEPMAVVQQYVADVGRPSPLPMWAFGPWMSGNEWNTDKRVREAVERTVAEGMPASVIVIEAWSDETTFYLFNEVSYSPVVGSDAVEIDDMSFGSMWPDPKGLVDWLHGQGVKVLLWQIPLLKAVDDHPQHSADLAHVKANTLAVQNDGGSEYLNRGWWFPRSRAIDFSNPDARKWWFNKRAYLLDDIGIDGFKTDGGEHLWGPDVVTHAGEVGDEAGNSYPNRYLAAYHDFLRGRGHTEPLTFSRAGFTGSQAFPAHWAGDENSTWTAFRASLIAGLSAGASGVAFWTWDLAGFSQELPTAELFKRATAMATFCPIMQYHSEHNEFKEPLADRTPWNVADQTEDDSVMDVYRFYSRLRMNLVPYLVGLGHRAVESGTPLMRALVLEFPDDLVAAGVEDQFMLGSDLMVAPVLTEGATERSVYLPDGEWFDLWSGARVQPGSHVVSVVSDDIPVYVRGGAAIPLWMPETIALGGLVGLPGEGEGQQVLMLFPGTAERRLVDPLSMSDWWVGSELVANRLSVSAVDAPEGVTLWVRYTDEDQYVSLPSGNGDVTLEVSGHVN